MQYQEKKIMYYKQMIMSFDLEGAGGGWGKLAKRQKFSICRAVGLGLFIML